MPSFKTPTQQQIDTAVQRLRSPEFSAYFFSRLENPRWVQALKEQGLFASPPPPYSVEGGGVTFPHWPASKYLARMAKHVPAEVGAIFTSMETDNVFVIGDMIEAALAMPANTAATLVPVISQAVKAGTFWVHFDEASTLCVRLADGGEAAAAMQLAEALFEPRFEEGQEQPSGRDEYWYKAGLQKVVPALVEREPSLFLARMCDWLKSSVDARGIVDVDSGSDYSYMWRPAIEEHEQNQDYEFAGVMVGFVRLGFEQAIRDGNLSLDEALETIAGYSFLIFRRIRIHLANEFAEQNPELARQIMMDRESFDSSEYKHEYAMLVGRRLNFLTAEERDAWLGWVDAGPDMSDFDEHVKEGRGRNATEDDRQNRIRYWQFEKLHRVRRHLEGDRSAFYETMLNQHGEPELADLNVHSGQVRWGHDSPMTVEDLANLPFSQVVERVSSWESVGDIFVGPNKEGLAATFGKYVATSPEMFSAQATDLIGRQSIFVRRFIEGMAEAVTNGSDINIHSTLELCGWVLEQSPAEQTTGNAGGKESKEQDWQWTRDVISRFLRGICDAKIHNSPKYPLEGLRDPTWDLISSLCRDRASSYIVRDVSADDPRTHDYLHLGINAPRGQAMEAALAYAGWIANHIKTNDGKNEKIPGGFDAMPEVREILEWQLAPDNRSIEVLAVIGSRISLIYWIEKDWLAAIAGRLFNLEGIEDSPPMPDGWAAWNAFLVWGGPHIELYRMFKEQFLYAVEQSTLVAPTERSREQPMYRLGEHLMILYGRGELGFDDDEGLLRRFLADSIPDIRRHAVGFVGRSIRGNDNLPQEIVSRFQVLWEMYWGGAGRRDVEEKPDAWLFGTWFSSGQFPDQWALEQLEQFVAISPNPEPDHAIAERLAIIAQVDIARTIRILDRIVRGDREGWRIHMRLEPTRQILDYAMEAGGDARTQAENIIEFLGRRGYTEFGELLKR